MDSPVARSPMLLNSWQIMLGTAFKP